MNVNDAAKFVEALLNKEKLSYRIVKNKKFVFFNNLDIGYCSVIAVKQNKVSIIVQLKSKDEIRSMNVLCNSLKKRFTLLRCTAVKKGNTVLFRLQLPMDKITDFETILVAVNSEFQQELSMFVLDDTRKNPDLFFTEQYNIWQSIPSVEQSSILEEIMVIKERYFGTTKTKHGIVVKLYKVKKMLSARYKEQSEGKLDDMFLKEQSSNSFYEFYLLDFAAMFRAIELGLIKFKVSDFFKNYEIRRPG